MMSHAARGISDRDIQSRCPRGVRTLLPPEFPLGLGGETAGRGWCRATNRAVKKDVLLFIRCLPDHASCELLPKPFDEEIRSELARRQEPFAVCLGRISLP